MKYFKDYYNIHTTVTYIGEGRDDCSNDAKVVAMKLTTVPSSPTWI